MDWIYLALSAALFALMWGLAVLGDRLGKSQGDRQSGGAKP